MVLIFFSQYPILCHLIMEVHSKLLSVKLGALLVRFNTEVIKKQCILQHLGS